MPDVHGSHQKNIFLIAIVKVTGFLAILPKMDVLGIEGEPVPDRFAFIIAVMGTFYLICGSGNPPDKVRTEIPFM